MEVERVEQVVEFCKRLLAEVAELEQVVAIVTHQIAYGIHFGSLKTVERPHRKVLIGKLCLEKLAHVEYILVEFLAHIALFHIDGDLLIREEHEVVDKYLGRLFQCFLGMYRAVCRDFEVEFLVVGLLLYAVVLNGVFHVLYRSVDRVYRKNAELGFGLAGRGHIRVPCLS